MFGSSIKPGDIVFFIKPKIPNNSFQTTSKTTTTFIDAVCASSTSTSTSPSSIVDSNVFHVGIFIDEFTIIHSTSNKGVIKELFMDAINFEQQQSSIIRIEIYRIKNASKNQINNAIKFAESILGSKYNNIFSPNFINSNNQKAFYCCQLICEAYGREMFPPHKLNFKDKNGNLIDFWIKYFNERNQPIPQGLPGSHPSIIKSSQNLCLIKTFKIQNNGKLFESRRILVDGGDEKQQQKDTNNNNNFVLKTRDC